jgi:predicted nucleotidyltransferase
MNTVSVVTNSGLKETTVKKIQQVLADYPDVRKAVLYGSRAMENYRPGSDIDLTLEGEALTLKQLNAIEIELDELLLPYEIDLSIKHQIDNPDLLEHIKRVGVVFYTRAGRP